MKIINMIINGEIGSEFWAVPIAEKKTNIFPENTQWFLSGRSALQVILDEIKGFCRTVAMPSWCCDSMIKPFIDAGIEVHFYPVYWDNKLVINLCFEYDILFLMDYFGYSSKKPDLSGYDGVVIRDITHSIFSDKYDDADYYFGSLRKWCGIWTGGYTWTNDGHSLRFVEKDNKEYVQLRKKAMLQKKAYIERKIIGESEKQYLEFFASAEEMLENKGIASAAYRDVILASKLDSQFIIRQRRSNANILRRAFYEWLIFPDMTENDCPLFVPVLIPNGKRDALRQYLIEKDIYCPIHWPISMYHKLNEDMEYIYKNELSFICDQRYTEIDMKRIIKTVKAFCDSGA